MVARFGCIEIDPQRRQLFASGRLLHLTPKAFDPWSCPAPCPFLMPRCCGWEQG
jgi:hypothetical protein